MKCCRFFTIIAIVSSVSGLTTSEVHAAERSPEQGTITWQKTYEANAEYRVREAFNNAHSLLLEPGSTRTYGYTHDMVGGATVYARLSGTITFGVLEDTSNGVLVGATMTIDEVQGEADYLGEGTREGRLLTANVIYQPSGAAIISSMVYVDSATEKISLRPREALMDSLSIAFPPMPQAIRSTPVCTPFRWLCRIRNGEGGMLFSSDPREGGALITGNDVMSLAPENNSPMIYQSLLIEGVVRAGRMEEIVLREGIPQGRLTTQLTLVSYSK